MNIYCLAIASLKEGEESCEIEFAQGTSIEMKVTSQHFGIMSFVDDNLFGTLSKFRLRLEQEGYLLLCNAARKDAYPSRMTLEMGGGRKIYLLKSGVQTKREDLVDTLGTASIDQVCTVSEQRAYYNDWIRSLK